MKPVDRDDLIRIVTGLLAMVATAVGLHGRGWPVWAWLPAALLAFVGSSIIWIISWYLRRKLTYRALARRTRDNLQAGGSGWTDDPPES